MCQNNDVDVSYGVEIGRWTGLFSMLWYADVFNSVSARREVTFTAWTRRGARAKALRYVARQTKGRQKDVTVEQAARIRW